MNSTRGNRFRAELWHSLRVNKGSKRAIYAAFGANLGITVAKLIGAIFTGSAGLLAETLHSFADTGNQALLLLGGARSQRPATREHQFGYGAERYFWSFVVALVLFSLGGLFALYEGVQKLINPHETSYFALALTILVAAFVLETYSLRTAVKEARKLKSPTISWWRYIKNAKEPELPVVLLEDIGAEIGLSFALLGVVLAHLTGETRWDAVGSLAIGLLLIAIACILAIEMKSLLIGESAAVEVEDVITAALMSSPEVRNIIHMKTMHLGPEEVLLAVKIEFNNALSVTQLAKAIDEVELLARAATGATLRIFIEPDISRTVT